MPDFWKYMVSSDVEGLADINTCNKFLRALFVANFSQQKENRKYTGSQYY